MDLIKTVDMTNVFKPFQRGLNIYLRVTESCQLNCDHCMTDGSEADPIIIDFEKAQDFLIQIYELNPEIPYIRVQLHGGEPLLVDAEKILNFSEDLQKYIPKDKLIWTIQTNLVYSLTSSREKVLLELCQGSFGTSWDKDIRFKNPAQLKLWESNVRALSDKGCDITVLVSLNHEILKCGIVELAHYFASLGIKHVTFERITVDGHATRMNLPTNHEVDMWLLSSWKLTLEHKLYNVIHNVYLGDIARSMQTHSGAGTHCRNCESQILTLRATGQVSGCPNTANSITYGDYKNAYAALTSTTRAVQIEKEMSVNPNCLACPAYSFCRGNCYKLEWDTHCPAPKSLFIEMMSDDSWHELVPELDGELLI